MSMLQRLWGSHPKEKEKPDEKQSAEVEEITDDQPHNPYSEILVLHQHTDIVRTLLKIDHKRCASAGDDGKVIIWDIQVGRKLQVLSGHSHRITCMLLLMPQRDSSDDWLLLTGSSDKQIRVWDIDTGTCRHVITEHNSSIKCLVTMGDGEIFCGGGEHLSVWRHDGKLLHMVHRKDQEDISLMIVVKTDHIVTAADKQLVVYSVVNPMTGGEPDDKEISLVKKLPSHREAIHSLISISESCFASGSIDGTIILWTSQNFLPAKTFNTVSEYVGDKHLYPYSIQSMFCVQERYLFAAMGSGFCMFDVSVGKERVAVRKLAAHFSKILHIGLACDGAFLVTSSEDGSIRLWGRAPASEDYDSAHDYLNLLLPMERFTGLSGEQLKQVNFAEHILDVSLLGECVAHSGSVQTFVDFDHEGLVSCGTDGLVIVWKNAELQKVRRNQKVREILLSVDGIV
ncbi:WD repeat-containing protein 41-like [Haliotis rubra]|uniref:WD repeat-containing protein 41-like n=1 Tax=Haliotis rubra TaxID=36100 RepID=UPI001EE5BF57|nr:WD repeat-containing protein 41-like [Haliotis rubra]